MFEMFENEKISEQGCVMENTRRQEILGILYEKGRASVGELSRTLFVSEMTVRRDLAELEREGYLKRYRGGAVLKTDSRELPIDARLLVDEAEKKELCARCEVFLKDGMTVFLDSSSTCLYIIPYLAKRKNILMVTNSVKALQNASALHIPTVLIGGEYYAQDMCLVGSIAEQYASELNIDVAFMTTAALGSDGVISDFDLRQTAVRRIVMKNAQACVFLFERSKRGKKLTYTLCHRDNATAVIVLDEE